MNSSYGNFLLSIIRKHVDDPFQMELVKKCRLEFKNQTHLDEKVFEEIYKRVLSEITSRVDQDTCPSKN